MGQSAVGTDCHRDSVIRYQRVNKGGKVRPGGETAERTVRNWQNTTQIQRQEKIKIPPGKHCDTTQKHQRQKHGQLSVGRKVNLENVDDSDITIARESLRLPQGLSRLLANW